MKAATPLTAFLILAVAAGAARAGGSSSFSISYGQTFTRGQPCSGNQQSLSVGFTVGSGCVQPAPYAACGQVVMPYPPVAVAPRPVVVVPAPVYLPYPPVVVPPPGMAVAAAHQIGLAHAAAAHRAVAAHAGLAHAAAAHRAAVAGAVFRRHHPW